MTRRLIEEAFPLKKVSEDSKHEKNVRHGHISTLHIWPARRPLAACRAAIIAALMPDPGDDKARDDLCRRIGNITRWKSENGPDLQFFRDEIRKAFGGRAPKVLDMFAGGGAIPLEAMRLGCDVTAIDYNPVAWFILKCTLEFPQRLAGRTWPLPERPQTADDRPHTTGGGQPALMDLGVQEGDLAAHVRYWGNWVLERARQELAPYYPTIDGKPTVAYLWARTVPCQDPKCGAEVPMLKTLWLSRKEGKLAALKLVPDKSIGRIAFEIIQPKNDDEVTNGTMAGGVNSSNVQCPCCGAYMRLEYIQSQGQSGRVGAVIIAVVTDGEFGKEYRLPTKEELLLASQVELSLTKAIQGLPFGLPSEQLDPLRPSKNAVGVSIVPRYGLDRFDKLFSRRQLLSIVTIAQLVRGVRENIRQEGYPDELAEAVCAYLALCIDRLTDYSSTICTWSNTRETIRSTFARFSLPMTWDYAETNPIGDRTGGFSGAVTWVAKYIEHALVATSAGSVRVLNGSAVNGILDDVVSQSGAFDAVITDPPYYDAIPYADISDYFYVWLRRTLDGFGYDPFSASLTPKVGELIQHSRHGDSFDKAKQFYEDGMAKAFEIAFNSLGPDGRMVIVFAHKDPIAWETLVSSMIRAGFVVSGSWPIDTEMTNRVRIRSSASLASSIWLVCRKRPTDAGVGRYVEVKKKMQERITERLRYFWDQGISGPDFMWAAVGPALESYSSHKEVRRMDGSPFTVGEFLKEVRRLVADFALGRILHGASTEGLDEWTRYYLMHRSNFRLVAAPVGECILLAQGYGLDLNELKGPRGFIAKGKAKKAVDQDEDADSTLPSESEEATSGGGSGSDIRLLSFDERKRDDLGEPHPSGGLPLIDMLHRLMRLWQAGDTEKLTTYVQQHGLSQNDLFWAVAQAVLEMADPKTKERTLLEALVAWGRGKPAHTADQPSLI